MTVATTPQTPRELVELWSAAAVHRLQAERAMQGQLSGTELNRLGELLISAATWLTENTKAMNEAARQMRLAALKRKPEYAAMSFANKVNAIESA